VRKLAYALHFGREEKQNGIINVAESGRKMEMDMYVARR